MARAGQNCEGWLRLLWLLGRPETSTSRNKAELPGVTKSDIHARIDARSGSSVGGSVRTVTFEYSIVRRPFVFGRSSCHARFLECLHL
jgi:hypothetical protein